jgi:predicted transcriptional regulator
MKIRGRRRNKLDIFADILKVALKGALKTHIVGKANLNFRLIPPYLKTLIDRGLLSRTREPFKSRYIYRTTPEGVEFLEHYQALIQAIEGPEK